MATLTTNQLDHAGTRFDTLLVAASGGGDQCSGGTANFLVVKNAGGSAITVTLTEPQTIDGLSVANRSVSVPAGALVMIPVEPYYVNPATNLASISYSGVASVTIAAFQAGV